MFYVYQVLLYFMVFTIISSIITTCYYYYISSVLHYNSNIILLLLSLSIFTLSKSHPANRVEAVRTENGIAES